MKRVVRFKNVYLNMDRVSRIDFKEDKGFIIVRFFANSIRISYIHTDIKWEDLKEFKLWLFAKLHIGAGNITNMLEFHDRNKQSKGLSLK